MFATDDAEVFGKSSRDRPCLVRYLLVREHGLGKNIAVDRGLESGVLGEEMRKLHASKLDRGK